jgi:hypothetical protein
MNRLGKWVTDKQLLALIGKYLRAEVSIKGQRENHQLENISGNTASLAQTMTEKEKRPQDWSLEERLKLIIKMDGCFSAFNTR